MRRARIAVVALTVALALSAPGAVRALQTDTRMSSVGILDYTLPPTFKVGDYVRYLVTTMDEKGTVDDRYYLTVMIAGQEVFWGERCFWVETWTDEDTARVRSVELALMSYDIFKDPKASENLLDYQRKIADEFDEKTGQLIETLVSPNTVSLTTRRSKAEVPSLQVDTLGIDTTQTPLGTFRSPVIVARSAWGKAGGSGDSTVYKERRDDHTTWNAPEIPLTGNVRDEMWMRETRRTWMVGHSKESTPEVLVGARHVVARLVGYGHGLKSRLLPPSRAHGFDDAPPARRSAAAVRPRPAAGGAARR
jgi:hypothetical protein